MSSPYHRTARRSPTWPISNCICAQPIDRNGRQVIVHGGHARLLPSGELIYAHGGSLFGGRLDSKSWTLIAPSVPLVEGVSMNAGGQFDVSRNGTLAYVSADGAGL